MRIVQSSNTHAGARNASSHHRPPHSLYERSDPDEGVTNLSAAYGLALGLDAMVGQLVPLVRLHLP